MTSFDFVSIFIILNSLNEMRKYKENYVKLTNDLEYKKINKFRIIEFSSNWCLMISCIAMIYCEYFDEFSKIIAAIGGITFVSAALIMAYRNFKFLNNKDFPEYNTVYLDTCNKYIKGEIKGEIKWLLIITVVMLLFLFIRYYLGKLL